MAQYARPSSDIAAGNWTASTGSDLYAMIDEVSASDSDYISGDETATTAEIALSAVTDPVSSASHTISVRARTVSGSGPGEKLDIDLVQGTTVIANAWINWNPNDSTFATETYTLLAAEADSITDYSDLRLRFIVDTLGINNYCCISLSVSFFYIAPAV